MKGIIKPDGTIEFEGTPEEIVNMQAIIAGRMQTQPEPAAPQQTAQTQSDPKPLPKRKRDRSGPRNRDYARYTPAERRDRVIKVLKFLSKENREVLGQDIGELLDLKVLTGLGSVMKDVKTYAADHGFEETDAIIIRGSNPRRYRAGYKISSVLGALLGQSQLEPVDPSDPLKGFYSN